MNISTITREDILTMSYNELIGLVRETNRAPGGNRALIKAIQDGFINANKQVLEIGTSTGVTAIELARLSGCEVTGIDLNEMSLEEARLRAKRYGVSHLTQFIKDDATNLSFADKTFDVVFCGNVTSLVSDRKKALQEYARVLKPGGLLIAIPMYYTQKPAIEMVEQVRQAIQVNYEIQYRKDWMTFFQDDSFELFLADHFQFDNISSDLVSNFVEVILKQEHLKELDETVFETLRERYHYMMMLFRNNLAHMGFTIIFLRKELEPMDPELFTSHQV